MYTHLESPADRFLKSGLIEIGYDDTSGSCYLFYERVEKNQKNAVVRCDESKGDKFWVKKSTSSIINPYKIGFQNCPLYWTHNGRGTLSAVFVRGLSGNNFWIRQNANGKWAIGVSDCSMFLESQNSTNVRNAELKCGEEPEYVFSIKGAQISSLKQNYKSESDCVR